MSASLIDSVKSVFTSPLLSKFSTLLGEPETNIQQGIHAAIVLVLTDILHKAHFPAGTTKITHLAKQAAHSDFSGQVSEWLTDTGGLVTGSVLLSKGSEFARAQLAGHMDPVIMEVGRQSGISTPSASFITGIVSFASLDAVGRHWAHLNENGGALSRWLKTQTNGIIRAIPHDLRIKRALEIHHYPWENPVTDRRRNTPWYIIVILIILLIIVFFLYRSWGRSDMQSL